MVAERIFPNFFVAGAPKCGTTALSEYLRAHPNVFMSYPKEPSYFADDLTYFHAIKTLRDYQALFRKCTAGHIAVGEASVWYLYSEAAMKRIRAYNKDGKIILIFRNPIDFLQSFHTQQVFDFNEDRRDFVEAWNLQEARRNGRDIPTTSVAPQILQYRNVARFGDQLERLLTVFPTKQVKCILFDDLAADPRAVYRDVLVFLGVPDDGRTDFARINEAKQHRSQRLGVLLKRPPPQLRAAWRGLKTIFGNEITKFVDRAITSNAAPAERAILPPEFRCQLSEAFRGDVAKLSYLLGRDLSSWLDPERDNAEPG